jgi:hypothetical protein
MAAARAVRARPARAVRAPAARAELGEAAARQGRGERADRRTTAGRRPTPAPTAARAIRSCTPPAKCEATDGPRTWGPPGTIDTTGDASACLKDNGRCARQRGAHGHCIGGTCCAVGCDTPGVCQTVAGTTCTGGTTCNYGRQNDGASCDDGDACTVNVCSSGACVVDTPTDCNDNDQCTTDTCTSPTGCVHTPVNGPACNDNNPCTTDLCPANGGLPA